MAPIGVGALLLIGVAALYLVGDRPPPIDDRGCPEDTGPVGATVLLLDTSDPLTPKHRAELQRLGSQIASEPAGRFGIGPGELLAVYELTQDPDSPKPLVQVCRPFKRLEDRTWRDDIHQGNRVAEGDWSRFEEALAKLFPQGQSEPRSHSPLLETITVLAPRHVPGRRGNPDFEVHLVVFSDLLQHTDRISHYGPYPDAKAMRREARDLFTDLTGAKVSLFRLERPEYARWQTEHHYYWWTELILEQGGQIEWQESI